MWHSRKAAHLGPGIENTPVAVNIYRKDFPVLSYLCQGFLRKSGAVEQDERIAAARQSLLYLIASALAVAMIAALLAAQVLAR